MKERLVTLAGALGALALFLTMFLHQERQARGDDKAPPTTELRGENGYRAAVEWLEAEHIRTVSLRNRFDRLATRSDITRTGNMLVITLPARTNYRTDEFRPLDRWVRAGNTLVVLAALADRPDWGMPVSVPGGDLDLLTGLEVESAQPHQERKARRFSLLPNRVHPYFDGVHEVSAWSDRPSQLYSAKVPYDGFVFALAHDADSGADVLWTRPLGEGRIIASAFGSLFTNRALAHADNARLLGNMVAISLGPRGTVLFDDVHQGLGAAYDPAKFYADRRLYVTVAILAAVWLLWVLGATRLRVPVKRTPAPREVELVRATGTFMARVLTPSAAARGMFGHFLQRVTALGNTQMQPSLDPAGAWDILERRARVEPADVRQLKLWYRQVQSSQRVPLRRLHNLLLRVTRQMYS